jgi:hypothetical protein
LKRVPDTSDLFHDPDTGICRPRRSLTNENGIKYIRVGEIKDLLAAADDRVIVVYRHAREKLPTLANHVKSYAVAIEDCYAIAVDGGAATAALFSYSRPRLQVIRTTLVQHFGPLAEDRVSSIM